MSRRAVPKANTGARSAPVFEGLRQSGRKPWQAETVLATADHNVPTTDRAEVIRTGLKDSLSRAQVDQLGRNYREFGITEFGLSDPRQGIIHVIGPEQGATLPGMTVVAGDSHTSTHGAFGALAFGVGTSEVEHAGRRPDSCLRAGKAQPGTLVIRQQCQPSARLIKQH